MTNVSEPAPARNGDVPEVVVPKQVVVPTSVVVRTGLVLWLVALVVVAAVPDLRTGDRSWWIWVPVAALALGGVGHVYLRRGRGNAAGA